MCCSFNHTPCNRSGWWQSLTAADETTRVQLDNPVPPCAAAAPFATAIPQPACFTLASSTWCSCTSLQHMNTEDEADTLVKRQSWDHHKNNSTTNILQRLKLVFEPWRKACSSSTSGGHATHCHQSFFHPMRYGSHPLNNASQHFCSLSRSFPAGVTSESLSRP